MNTQTTKNGGTSDKVDALVRVAAALGNFNGIMAAPRMDSDRQHWEAVKAVLHAYDRKTAKQFRIMVNELRDSNVTGEPSREKA